VTLTQANIILKKILPKLDRPPKLRGRRFAPMPWEDWQPLHLRAEPFTDGSRAVDEWDLRSGAIHGYLTLESAVIGTIDRARGILPPRPAVDLTPLTAIERQHLRDLVCAFEPELLAREAAHQAGEPGSWWSSWGYPLENARDTVDALKQALDAAQKEEEEDTDTVPETLATEMRDRNVGIEKSWDDALRALVREQQAAHDEQDEADA
jgi:hypothetical protein